jgi:hypothetical protein
MPTNTQTRRGTKKAAAAKPAPAPDPVDEDTEDDDLEELEEDEVQEATTAKRGSDDVLFGVADLCRILSKGAPKPVTPRELRQLIRKMARENDPRVQREITAGNRSRYSWSGPKDPEVLAIIAAFKGGELEADKQEKLAALKAQKAAKKTAEPAAVKSKSKKRAAAAPVEEDDVEELELDDDED